MAKTVSFNPSQLEPERVAPILYANVMDRFIDNQLLREGNNSKAVNFTAHFIQRLLVAHKNSK